MEEVKPSACDATGCEAFLVEEAIRHLQDNDMPLMAKAVRAAVSARSEIAEKGAVAVLRKALPFINKAFMETPQLGSGERFEIYRALCRALPESPFHEKAPQPAGCAKAAEECWPCATCGAVQPSQCASPSSVPSATPQKIQTGVYETVVQSPAPSPAIEQKPDPIAEMCKSIRNDIRLCDHGYIHITCGDCQRRG